MTKRNRQLLIWLLSILMFGAVGCDAVGGSDANRAIQSLAEVESKEGAMALAWELVKDPNATLDQKEEAVLDVLGEGSLRLTEVKQQDRRTMSAKGELVLKEASIPFDMVVNGQELVLDIEGAKIPYRIDLLSAMNDMYGTPFAGMGVGDVLLSGDGATLLDTVVGYAAGHLPSPERTTVSEVRETIGGEEKPLTKVTYELQGEELKSILLAAINSIMKDEDGLKALIGELYDQLKPQLEQRLKEAPPIVQFVLQNKESAVNAVYGQISIRLSEWAGHMEIAPDHKVVMSWLLDGGDIVGMDADISVPGNAEKQSGISAIHLSIHNRWWNVNEKVIAATYDGETVDLSKEVRPRERLRNIEEDSALYDILKHTLRVTEHSFRMYMGDSAEIRDGVSPYIKAGTTMVPVRYVSEQLDAEVIWDKTDSSITIVDEEEGIRIMMQIGSKKVLVNGEEQLLAEAPEQVFGTTFVPIAFITKALNGDAEWDPVKRTVTITKEF